MTRLLVLLFAAIVLQGCVAASDVKLASSQTVSALTALGQAEETFRRAYLQEIDRTRAVVERSIVAVTVTERVNQLAAEHEQKGNLIQLSREIEAAETATRAMIDEVSRLKEGVEGAAKAEATLAAQQPSERERVRKVVSEYIGKKREDLLKTANLLPPNDPVRVELETAAASAGKLAEQRTMDRLYTLLHLSAMRVEAQRNLVDLRDAIANLQAIHAEIDAWIQQDVTVSGADVAKLVDKHAGTLGLAPRPGGR